MTTAIYIRLSQNRGGDEDKPDRQRKTCEAWLSAHQVQTWSEYLDDDVSAYKGKARPAWSRLLADIEAGHVTQVVSLHLDRLLRSMTQLEALVDLVEATKVTIHTVESGELDLTTSAGRQMARILAAVTTGESERKAERHRSKAEQLRSQGKSTGGARPFGWKSPNGELEAAEAELISSGIKTMLEGGTLYAVRRQWIASGISSSFGNGWPNNKSVGRILVRWRNAGLVEHQGQIVGKAVWPAIVTQEQVAAVRQILSDPARKTSPGPARKWLLSGIAACGKCGTPMKKQKSSRGVDHYRCSNDQGCYLSIPYDRADKVVTDAVRTIFAMSDPASFAITDSDREALTTLRSERSQMASESDLVGKAIGEGTIPFTAAQIALQGLSERMAEIDRQLGIIASRLATADMLAEPAKVGTSISFEKTAEVGKRFAALSLDKRRAIIRELFESITVLPGRGSAQDRIILTRKSAI